MVVDIYNTDKKYNIIYADPPWSYRNMGNIQATANSHYNTMKQKDIEDMGETIKEISEILNVDYKFLKDPK